MTPQGGGGGGETRCLRAHARALVHARRGRSVLCNVFPVTSQPSLRRKVALRDISAAVRAPDRTPPSSSSSSSSSCTSSS